MAASTIETVRRLLELAGNTPTNDTPEYQRERESAALKAAQLIIRFSLPVGDNVIHRSDKEWVPPPPDFYTTVADIFKGVQKDPDAEATAYDQPYAGAPPPGQPAGLTTPETELQDQKSAFAQQVVTAWRAIRETRKALQAEIYRFEQKTRTRFDPTMGRGLADWSSSRMSPIVGSSDWMFRADDGGRWRLVPTGDPSQPLMILREEHPL